MKNSLKILIIGEPKTGKTTTAHVILDALQDAGYTNVQFKDQEPSKGYKPPITERVKETQARPVHVEVIHANRLHPLTDEDAKRTRMDELCKLYDFCGESLKPSNELAYQFVKHSWTNGKSTHRFKTNPHELVAAKIWAEHNRDQDTSGILPCLLGNGQTLRTPTQEEWLVASTLMQWLGSPVGRSYLRDLQRQWDYLDATLAQKRSM